MIQSFGYFLNAIARWNRPSEQLNGMFKTVRFSFSPRFAHVLTRSSSQILVAFKNMTDASAWEAQLSQLPAPIVARLRERYAI